MKREDLIRKLKKLARKNGIYCSFDAAHGKGGHGMLSWNGKKTTVPSGELKTSTLLAILKQIQVDKNDL